MINLYRVDVEPNMEPIFEKQKFLFDSKEEAQKFCDYVEKRTDWAYTSPIATHEPEIFDAVTAFNYVIDEINANKKRA